ncbi:MAG TPA: 6-phosphogluconolactonase [Phycisphaerales bacterium]|nr:6-phosphogluconolactonase [Phycisphaerales bacterium]
MLEVGDELLPTPPNPRKPDLPGTVVTRHTLEDLLDTLLTDVLSQAQSCVRAFGDFHLALAASEAMEPVMVRMMLDPAYRALPWKRTHLWLVDDCTVDIDDDRSRAKRVREILVDHADIPVDQVHGIMVASDDPAGEYQEELRQTLAWREKGHDRLDFALLGLGHGGTAAALLSARPGEHPPADSGGSLVLARPWKDPENLSWYGLSPRTINASRFIGVIAAGKASRSDLAHLERQRKLPSAPQIIRPIGGELRWYVDGEALPEAASVHAH